MNYETSLEDSKINKRKDKILHEMEKKKMPKIGTTMIDAEGLALIRSFVESLR